MHNPMSNGWLSKRLRMEEGMKNVKMRKSGMILLFSLVLSENSPEKQRATRLVKLEHFPSSQFLFALLPVHTEKISISYQM